MKVKPTNVYKHLTLHYIILYYTHSKFRTCTCFGQSCGHPHRGAKQSVHYKIYGGTYGKHSSLQEKKM